MANFHGQNKLEALEVAALSKVPCFLLMINILNWWFLVNLTAQKNLNCGILSYDPCEPLRPQCKM